MLNEDKGIKDKQGTRKRYSFIVHTQNNQMSKRFRLDDSLQIFRRISRRAGFSLLNNHELNL